MLKEAVSWLYRCRESDGIMEINITGLIMLSDCRVANQSEESSRQVCKRINDSFCPIILSRYGNTLGIDRASRSFVVFVVNFLAQSWAR